MRLREGHARRRLEDIAKGAVAKPDTYISQLQAEKPDNLLRSDRLTRCALIALAICRRVRQSDAKSRAAHHAAGKFDRSAQSFDSSLGDAKPDTKTVPIV